MNKNEAPVKAGEEYEVSITAVGGKGDGIAKVKGFVLFVPNVKKGDFVKVRITKVLANVGFAEVVKQLEQQEKEPKFATVSAEELTQEEEPKSQYEESEDFGEDA